MTSSKQKQATALVVVGTIAAFAVLSGNSGLGQGSYLAHLNSLNNHDEKDIDSAFA
jgi:hypothetical protein